MIPCWHSFVSTYYSNHILCTLKKDKIELYYNIWSTGQETLLSTAHKASNFFLGYRCSQKCNISKQWTYDEEIISRSKNCNFWPNIILYCYSHDSNQVSFYQGLLGRLWSQYYKFYNQLVALHTWHTAKISSSTWVQCDELLCDMPAGSCSHLRYIYFQSPLHSFLTISQSQTPLVRTIGHIGCTLHT